MTDTLTAIKSPANEAAVKTGLGLACERNLADFSPQLNFTF